MMLAIQRKEEAVAVKVNILPCKVNYDGPVEVERRYWRPEHIQDSKHRAYFRGRELEGNAIEVPKGYRGSVLHITGDVIPAQRPPGPQEDDEDEVEVTSGEIKAAEELGTFDEVMIWNHDVPWDAAEDSYAKGIGEWMSFANAMHSQDHTSQESKPSQKPS